MGDVSVGRPADLALLAVNRERALTRLQRDDVVATIVAGHVVYDGR